MSGWWERDRPPLVGPGRLEKDASALLALLIELRDGWFEPHYGTNDVGMAALLRDKIRAAITHAEGKK